MKNTYITLTFLISALISNAQCDPGLINHYNMGDFPFISSSGVTVTMAGTNSGTLGPYGPYGCSPAICDANTIRLDPGDTLIFNFSQLVYDVTFVAGVMNLTENGIITTDNGMPILNTNCPTDLLITGNAFEQIGALASPVITVSIPNGATSISIVSLPALTSNGIFTVDMLDCINILCSTTSNLIDSFCDSYTSPSGNHTWTTSGIYNDTIPNSAGCDSVITIDLTITNSSAGTDTQTACDSYTWINGNTYSTSTNTPTWTLTNLQGCDSIVTLNLTINSVDSSVTQAGVLLTANEIGATYQWIECSGMTLIIGATNQSYVATTIGDYAVIVSNNGCSDTSACYTLTEVGIIENNFGNGLLLFPNPTDGNFSIDLGENFKEITITLTDIGGSLIQSNKYYESQLLNLRLEEPAGLYLLIIESGNKKSIIRLVKE